MRPVLTAVVCSLILVAGTVRAEDLVTTPESAPGSKPVAGTSNKDDSSGSKTSNEWMKRFDKNGDGKLDETEKAAAKAAYQEKLANMKEKNPDTFKHMDTNGDGTVSPEEAKTYWTKHKAGGGTAAGKTPEPTVDRKNLNL